MLRSCNALFSIALPSFFFLRLLFLRLTFALLRQSPGKAICWKCSDHLLRAR